MSKSLFDAVVFDCDGTLSSVEGIVELAAWNDVESMVAELTEQAMGNTGMTPDIYSQRISATRPTKQQCLDLAKAYYEQRTPYIDEVLAHCRDQGVAVYIVSAGVNPAVTAFAEQLGIELSHVFAVDLSFDEQGRYVDFDHQSPMTTGGGKRLVIERIKQRHSRILYVGDGKNDLDVYDDVAQFVGYGGAYYRPAIEAQCEHYITDKSLQPLMQFLQPALNRSKT